MIIFTGTGQGHQLESRRIGLVGREAGTGEKDVHIVEIETGTEEGGLEAGVGGHAVRSGPNAGGHQVGPGGHTAETAAVVSLRKRLNLTRMLTRRSRRGR